MLSVVIETLNDEDPLARTLSSLVGPAVEGAVREVIVCDRGSTDGTVERLQRAGFRVGSIDKREFDHGRTRDRGIALTTGEFSMPSEFDAVSDEAESPESGLEAEQLRQTIARTVAAMPPKATSAV